MTTYSKDLALIFFGSRIGEPVDLTVGMKTIHYFIIGLALLPTGIVIYFRSGKVLHQGRPNCRMT